VVRVARCSAPICPLDADWRLRTPLDGEPVCACLSETVKPAGKASLAYTLLENQTELRAPAYAELDQIFCPLFAAESFT
jgi:hypothetical protein